MMFYIGGHRNRRSLYNIKALSRIETLGEGIRNKYSQKIKKTTSTLYIDDSLFL